MPDFVKPLLDWRRAIAVFAGVLAAAAVSAAIAGREYFRVREIHLSMPLTNELTQAMAEERMVYAIVVGSAAGAALLVCLALAVVRPAAQPLIAVCVAPVLAFAAILPVYQFIYRDVPPGWHVSIAGEHRLAQPAGVVAALLAYAAARVIQRLAARRS